MAPIIPWNGRLGVSYTYDNGDAEAGPIGPAALEWNGKISFASQHVRENFAKLRTRAFERIRVIGSLS
jgi:hypothetical protein